jgi:ATP-binding protein involved in chromosome partitioning
MKIVSIASGKGGTGKSVLSVSIALALARRGFKVGLVDCDVEGPNICDILGSNPIEIKGDVFIPAESRGVKYISLAHIVSERDPILWSGKDYRSAAKQLLERVDWGNLDYVVLDLPPGTGEPLQEMLPLADFLIIVTVPSHLSESKVTRMVEMARETQTPILGLVKNMVYYECECGRRVRIFPEDHSFEDCGVPTLFEVPLSPKVAKEKVINDIPIDLVLEAMRHPVLLERRKPSLKARLLRAIFKLV